MKNIRNILILFVPVFMAGCKSHKVNTPVETTQVQANSDFISGKVNDIKQGKDGYTARITTADNLLYYATISRVNLKNAEQYKTVAIGETITIKGDIWKLENENHITVREMK